MWQFTVQVRAQRSHLFSSSCWTCFRKAEDERAFSCLMLRCLLTSRSDAVEPPSVLLIGPPAKILSMADVIHPDDDPTINPVFRTGESGLDHAKSFSLPCLQHMVFPPFLDHETLQSSEHPQLPPPILQKKSRGMPRLVSPIPPTLDSRLSGCVTLGGGGAPECAFFPRM